MLIEAALIIEMHRTNPRLDDQTTSQYTAWVLEQSAKHDLDPWLLFSLVHVESRWTSSAFLLEHDGSCSIGLGQINVPSCERRLVLPLYDPHENLRRVGHRLALLRRVCKKDCEGIGFVRGYNPGCKPYVSLIESVLRRCHALYESVVRDLPSRLHFPRLWRSSSC